jgi:cobalamin biosynthesis protein CobT
VHLDSAKRIEYVASGLPPPFEAYGQQAHFVLESCEDASRHPKVSCKDYTLREASKAGARLSLVFSNYNTIFGVVRNKRDALSTKKRKAALAEEEKESSSEEEEIEENKTVEESSSEEEEDSEESEDLSEVDEEEEEEEEEEEDEHPSKKT